MVIDKGMKPFRGVKANWNFGMRIAEQKSMVYQMTMQLGCRTTGYITLKCGYQNITESGNRVPGYEGISKDFCVA